MARVLHARARVCAVDECAGLSQFFSSVEARGRRRDRARRTEGRALDIAAPFGCASGGQVKKKGNPTSRYRARRWPTLPTVTRTHTYTYTMTGPPPGMGCDARHAGEKSGTVLQDYGFRLYNKASARFMSVDPLAASYPMWSPYGFAANTPLQAIDLEGAERFIVTRIWDDAGVQGFTVLAVSSANDVINLGARVTASQTKINGSQAPIGTQITANVLVYNRGNVPDGVPMYETSDQLTPDEMDAIRLGTNLVSRNTSSRDGKTAGSTTSIGSGLPGLDIPKIAGTGTTKVAASDRVAITRTVTTDHLVRSSVNAPPVVIRGKIAVNPLEGVITKDVTDPSGFTKLQSVVQSYSSSPEINISLWVPPSAAGTYETNRSAITKGFKSVTGYGGKINLLIGASGNSTGKTSLVVSVPGNQIETTTTTTTTSEEPTGEYEYVPR